MEAIQIQHLESQLANNQKRITYYKTLLYFANERNITSQSKFYKAILMNLLKYHASLASQMAYTKLTDIDIEDALWLLSINYSKIGGQYFIHP